MRFSVVVPAYNVSNYIGKCIESVIFQSFDDFELIIVNDGSTDDTLAICEEYRNKDSRIVLINQKNSGLVNARKSGALRSQGDYIICVDGDDYIESSLLDIINEKIEKTASDIICYGYYRDKDGEISEPVYSVLDEGDHLDISGIRKKYLYDPECKSENYGILLFTAWSKAVKRDIYIKAQNNVPNHIKNGEDVVLTAQELSLANSITAVRFAGYYYRSNPTSLTHVRTAYDLKNVSNVYQELQSTNIIPKENLACYCLTAYLILLRDMAKSCSTYKDFKNIVEPNISIDSEVGKARNKNLSLKKKILFRLIMKHYWKIIYFIFN